MSESDGLQKLTAFLKQTRRQSEAAIDALNCKIAELQKENIAYRNSMVKLEEERDYFRSLSEQLRQENTTKHRLQERDDWKSLIDSVQKDRSRLQDQCSNLELQLEQAQNEVLELKTQLDEIVLEKGEEQSDTLSVSPSESTESKHTSPPQNKSLQVSTSSKSNNGAIPPPLISPILDRSGNEIDLNLTSPAALARQLKVELKRAHSQIDAVQQKAEADMFSQSLEIQRLQDELRERHLPGRGGKQPALRGLASNCDVGSSVGRAAYSSLEKKKSTHQDSPAFNWMNPLGLLGFLFSNNDSDRLSSGPAISEV